MKLAVLLIFFIQFSIMALSQNDKEAFQLKLFSRFDAYPEFSYQIAGRPSIDHLKMKGFSLGFGVSYKFLSNLKYDIAAGIGYYRNRFNNLKKFNSSFGESESRHIDYPSLTDPVFFTNRYNYNTVSADFEIKRKIAISNKLRLRYGIDLSNFFTFSQNYKITNGDDKYKKRDTHFFAHSLSISSDLAKKIGKNSIGPFLSIPIFTIWRKDDVFPGENDSDLRSKLMNAFVVGVQYNF